MISLESNMIYHKQNNVPYDYTRDPASNHSGFRSSASRIVASILSHLLWRSYISVRTSHLFFSFYDYKCDLDFNSSIK